MDNFFDDCVLPDADSPLGFAQNRVASNVEGRTENCLSAALDDENTQYIAVIGNSIVTFDTEDECHAFLTNEQLSLLQPDFVKAIMPGTIDGRAIVAVPVQIEPDDVALPFSVIDARAVLYTSSIPEYQAGAVGMALSLLHWHNTNQYCGKCGAESRPHLGGMRRDCSACKTEIFPRTDPVVIMLAVRGNKCLLGRGPNFPPNWFSCLAGFVEPGETIEQAVSRETMEESGIKIGRVKYIASQPWPFPHSLMIGAFCEALSDDISFDGNELEDCRWFEREEVLTMIEKRHAQELRAPPSKSIAAYLLRSWLDKTA